MAKAERLIELMIRINAKRHFTVGELAKEFSVSKRTILRDLKALENVGVPLYSEVGAAGGYHVLKERVLPPVALSEGEAKAVFFACQSLQHYRDVPFELEAISAQNKFLNALPTDVQYGITQMQRKIVFWIPDRHTQTPLLKKLFSIVMNGNAATIRYSSVDKKSERTIVPIGLYAMGGLWYCPGFCVNSGSIREFRIDRIEEIVEEIPVPVGIKKIPVTIQEYLEDIEPTADIWVEIQLTEKGVKRCETEHLLARGLAKLPDGGGVIKMKLAYPTLPWLADYIISLGENATVVESGELMILIKQKVELLSAKYR